MAGSKEEKHFTLMFVRKGDEVLLGRRKRGHVNMRGKWNGFGGKVEAGEDILEVRSLTQLSSIDFSQSWK